MDSMHNTSPDDSEEKAKPGARKQILTGAIIVLIAAAIIAGIGTCSHYNARKSGPVVRNIADVSDFSIVFVDGKATLHWTDSIDDYLDHIEISWSPDGTSPDGAKPVSVAKGVETYVIPDLDEGVTYNFTVTAVGKWGNKSTGWTGGRGKAYKQPKYEVPPPAGATNDKDGIIGIKGTPVAGQATLSWTNPADSDYDHIEIYYDPNHENVIRIPKGAESKTLVGLANGLEHTFYAAAVDANGNRKPLKNVGVFISDFATSPESVFGRPSGGELTLVWDDPPPSADVDHLEIAYAANGGTATTSGEVPDGGTLIPVGKGTQKRTIAGLSDNTKYELTVYAVDSAGHRRPLTGVHLLPGLSSFGDDELDAIVRGNPVRGQINLDWTDPELEGLDHIEILTNPGDDGKMMTVPRGAQTNSFTGLNDDETYSFLAYGIDKDGNRQVIKGVKLSTPPPSLSEEEIRGMVRGKPVLGQITLDWTDPAFARLDHVDVVVNPDGDVRTITLAKNAQTQTFTGLSDDDIYSFLVYGVDSKGNKTIEDVTLSTPELPVVRAKPVLGEATLVWNDPDDPNFDHMEVTYRPNGTQAVTVEKGGKSQTFTGLSDDTEYEFHTTAVTTEGTRYAVATEVAVPELPVSTGTPTNGQITLDWTDPKNVAVDHIEIIYSGPDGKKNTMLATRGTETRDFTGLTDGQEYSFTVLAVDATGKKHPVTTARVRSARITSALPDIDPLILSGNLDPLDWGTIKDTTFQADQVVYALSFGFTANRIPRWVAGGSEGKISYSNDYGVNWVPAGDSHFGSHNVQTIGYANGRWIAGGKSGSMSWSTDAVNWTEIPDTYFITNDFSVNTIVFFNNRWMAGGGGGTIMVSEDNGLTWKLTTTNIPPQFDITTVAFHGGRWIAGATSGAMIYSDDNGGTWTAVRNSPFTNSAVNVIVYDQNRWMAAGYAQRLGWSEDGLTWKTMPRPFYVLCLAFNGYRWVAGGQDGRMAWSGDSGDTWTTDTMGRDFFGTNWVQAVAFGRSPDNHGRWLTGGQGGKMIYADEK